MNLSARIAKLEKLAAGIPEVNQADVEAVITFLESGDPDKLPEVPVDRAATLMVARSISDEDVGSFLGLAKIAEWINGSACVIEEEYRQKDPLTAGDALRILKALAIDARPWFVMLAEDDEGYFPVRMDPLPCEIHLSRLGLVIFFRVVHAKAGTFPEFPRDGEDEIGQKRMDS